MLIVKKKKALVFKLKDPGRILNVIPTAKPLRFKGMDLVVVPHRVEETSVLRNLGFNVPAPVSYQYTWPGQYKPFDAQKKTVEFLTQHKRAFCNNDIGCVDADTEYLTPTGWKRIAEYDGDAVGQYWPDTGLVDFVESPEYVKLPCDTMFHIKTKYGLDQVLSPEHRVLLVSKESPGKSEVVQAADLFLRQEQWLETGKNKKSLTTIGWSKAAVPVVYHVAGGDGVYGMPEAYLRVQIAVIADGHFPNHTNRCTVRLKKERKKVRFRRLLTEAGIEFRETSNDTPTSMGFTVFTFYAPERWKEFGPEFWGATHKQLAVVRDEVIHWDGCFRAGKTTREFISNSKASADFIQYAFNTGGYTARIVVDERGPTYSVLIRDNGKPLQVASSSVNGRNRVMTPIPSTDGFKYCFMVPSTFLILRRNGCVFASGNTGKTVSLAWAYDFLRSKGLHQKALVVSPLSTLERTWADEFFRNFPHLSVAVLHGTRAKRLTLLEDRSFDVYLINHDGVEIIEDALADRTDITLVIVDELAQVARNASTNRWKALNTVVNKQCIMRDVWGATGTPIPNNPTDAWAQVRLVNPKRVPPYFSKFRDMVMRQVSNFTWLPRPEALDVVKNVMQPAIRFSRDDCVDLPPCLYETREVELTASQKRAYRDMLARMQTDGESGQITAVNEAVKATKLLQIVCGVVRDDFGEEQVFDPGLRLKEVLEIAEECATKLIVYVPFVAVLKLVASHLAKHGVANEVVYGGVSKAERDRIFGEFQSPHGAKVLVAQPAAMSHGLTLTEASTIVWYAPLASNDVFEQANGRITRPGQRNNQFIIMLEGSEIERRYYKRLQNKQKVQGTLLEMIRAEEAA